MSMNYSRRLHSPSKIVASNALKKPSDETVSLTSIATALSSRSSGWGSVQSRKSYACLTSLDEIVVQQKREIGSELIMGDTWGYFVDTI